MLYHIVSETAGRFETVCVWPRNLLTYILPGFLFCAVKIALGSKVTKDLVRSKEVPSFFSSFKYITQQMIMV